MVIEPWRTPCLATFAEDRNDGQAGRRGSPPGSGFSRAITVLNVAIWLRTAVALQRERALQGPERRDYRRRQLILSALFVAGCAFRSIFPRADVQRICLYDNWLSVVLIGRAVATVAELAFMTQWAFLLGESAGPGQRDVAKIVSRVLVPIIAVAEICSWYAVLSTNYLGNAIEQSIWTFVFGAGARRPPCRASAGRGSVSWGSRRRSSARTSSSCRRSTFRCTSGAGGPTSRASGRISPSSRGCATPGSIAW